MSRRRRPLLLVFARSPEREAARKRLLGPDGAAVEADLHRACLDAALAAGRAVGADIVVSSPPGRAGEPRDEAGLRRIVQRGSSFGERLADAVGQVAAGDRPLLVVGGDVPELSADSLRRALAALERLRNGVVLGPSPDGGVYLLALRDADPDALRSIRWCSSRTQESLRATFRSRGRQVAELEPLVDLDRRADLERWVASLRSARRRLDPRWHRLLGAVRRMLGRVHIRPDVTPPPARLLAAAGPRDRAPPG